MAENTVEIVVKSRDKTSLGKMAIEGEAAAAAGRISQMFDNLGTHIRGRLSNIGAGLGKGGGIFAAGAGLLSMAGPLAAATAGIAAFGAVAIPTITQAEAASKKLAAAQATLAKATTPAAKAAAEQAVANDKLTGSQGKLVNAVGQLKSEFKGLETALTPLITSVVQAGGKLLGSLLPAVSQLAKMGGTVLMQFITPFTAFAKSPVFKQLIDQFVKFGTEAGAIVGPALVKLIEVFLQLFVAVMPAGVQLLQILLPLIVGLVTDLTPVIAMIADLIVVILQWLEKTHLLLPVLALVAIMIMSTEAPLLLLVAAVAVLIAIGVEFSKHWHQIWSDIKQWVADAVNFIKAHWQLILGILTGPIGLAVAWIISNWGKITSFFGKVVSTIAGAWKAITNFLTAPVKAAYDMIMGWFHDIASFVGSIPGMIGNAINGALGGIPGKILGAIGLEHGGIMGAAGGGPRGGLVRVGEHGQELIRLAPGSQVHSNPDTERMLSAAGGGGVQSVRVELVLSGGDADFRAFLKRSIRVHGGDPAVIGN